MSTTSSGQMSDAYKKKLIKYYLLCLASEGSKILVYSIFFLYFHLFTEFLFALILLMLVRTNGGGLHFKHYTTCFLFSFLVFAVSIHLGMYLSFPKIVAAAIVLASVMLGYLNVPITSANRPPADERLVKKSKRNTAIILSAFFILICIIPMNRYLNIGVWIIIIHIVQLLLAKLMKRRVRK